MKNFIELTNTKGRKELINIDYIVKIIPSKEDGVIIYLAMDLNNIFESKESYDAIKARMTECLS